MFPNSLSKRLFSAPESSPRPHLAFGCHVCCVPTSGVFPVLHGLRGLTLLTGTGQWFCKGPAVCPVEGFLMMRLRLQIWGKNPEKMNFSSHTGAPASASLVTVTGALLPGSGWGGSWGGWPLGTDSSVPPLPCLSFTVS